MVQQFQLAAYLHWILMRVLFLLFTQIQGIPAVQITCSSLPIGTRPKKTALIDIKTASYDLFLESIDDCVGAGRTRIAVQVEDAIALITAIYPADIDIIAIARGDQRSFYNFQGSGEWFELAEIGIVNIDRLIVVQYAGDIDITVLVAGSLCQRVARERNDSVQRVLRFVVYPPKLVEFREEDLPVLVKA